MQWSEWLLVNEPAVRLGCFLGVFAAVAVSERLVPRRALTLSRTMRWGNNIGLAVLNTLLLRLLFPATAVGIAAFAAQQGWGVLNYVELPFWLAVVIAVVALDLVIWLQDRKSVV